MKKVDLKDMSLEEFKAKKKEMSKKLSDLRFNKIMGHLDNPLEIRTLRRQIARLNTLIHQHELAEKQ